MGQLATGVNVVPTEAEAGLQGLTANAVASLSLNPPPGRAAATNIRHVIAVPGVL